MYFVVVCTCGFPIGHIWRKYLLAKLLTDTKYTKEVAELLADVQKAFEEDYE